MTCEGSRWGRTTGRAGVGAASGDGGAGTERHPGGGGRGLPERRGLMGAWGVSHEGPAESGPVASGVFEEQGGSTVRGGVPGKEGTCLSANAGARGV